MAIRISAGLVTPILSSALVWIDVFQANADETMQPMLMFGWSIGLVAHNIMMMYCPCIDSANVDIPYGSSSLTDIEY